MDVIEFWRYVLEQDADRLREFFCEDAYVNWHCTNEHFNVNEYIRANCEYPGEWTGELERTGENGESRRHGCHGSSCVSEGQKLVTSRHIIF